MKKVLGNPYLPFWEYVPDGEPYVFGDRLYIYGSHDEANCPNFCVNDYVVWSAPVTNLNDWQYHGISYSRLADPHNKDGGRMLFAPDVVFGKDGNYYLYYCLSFNEAFGVARSQSPEGPFEFYGHVHYKDGTLLDKHFPYDPSVLIDDDGRVYLYYGFAAHFTGGSFGKIEPSLGCYVVELASDMLTVVSEPVMCLPSDYNCEGTSFAKEHAYFEAPSMRKIKDKYYLVYSSQSQHELCYAVSDSPILGFEYGGVIISGGDVGIDNNQQPVNYVGTNHGGMVKILEQWYIFYHRNTHGVVSSRQGCAERIFIDENIGKIDQVPVSSYGLRGKTFDEKGIYSAYLACYLERTPSASHIRFGLDLKETEPYMYEEKIQDHYVHYIANILSGSKWGFNSFILDEHGCIRVCLKGKAKGKINISTDRNQHQIIGESVIDIDSQDWKWVDISYQCNQGEHCLYFLYEGDGVINVQSIELK